LAFRCSTPHSVFDAVDQRVLETFGSHRAALTDVLGRLDAETVGREELGGAGAPASGLEHPGVFLGSLVHDHLPFDGALRLATFLGSTRTPGFVRSFVGASITATAPIQPTTNSQTFGRAAWLHDSCGHFMNFRCRWARRMEKPTRCPSTARTELRRSSPSSGGAGATLIRRLKRSA